MAVAFWKWGETLNRKKVFCGSVQKDEGLISESRVQFELGLTKFVHALKQSLLYVA